MVVINILKKLVDDIEKYHVRIEKNTFTNNYLIDFQDANHKYRLFNRDRTISFYCEDIGSLANIEIDDACKYEILALCEKLYNASKEYTLNIMQNFVAESSEEWI